MFFDSCAVHPPYAEAAALKAAARAPVAKRAVAVVTRATSDEDVYIGKARGDYNGKGRFVKVRPPPQPTTTPPRR